MNKQQLKTKFIRIVNHHREARGLTWREIADGAGININALNAKIYAINHFSQLETVKIAKYLNIDLNILRD